MKNIQEFIEVKQYSWIGMKDEIKLCHTKIKRLDEAVDHLKNKVKYREYVILEADLLDKAVADFLDADAAWDNDEISEKDYCSVIDDLKEQMYSYRDKRQTVEIS